jgi:NitT/TauT family transport system substrate-binding protein
VEKSGQPQRLRLWIAAGLAAAVAAVALSACGGGGDSTDSGGSSTASDGGDEAPSLTVAIATTQSDILAYIAEAEGFFEEEGVPVTIMSETQANTSALVTSGKADLAAFAVTGPLAVAAQGQKASIVYSLIGGVSGGSMISDGGEISSVEDLKNHDGCKIGTFPPGTTAYGWALIYNETLELGCEIVALPEVNAQVGALKAGRVQALVGGYSTLQPIVKEGGGAFLIDTTDPAQAEKYGQPDPVEGAYWGMQSDLEGKSESVSRFLAALGKAREFVSSHSAAETAEVLHSIDAYSALPTSLIEEAIVPSFEAYLPPAGKDGFISEEAWEQELELLAQMEVPGFESADDPKFSYENMIDMSFLKAAE